MATNKYINIVVDSKKAESNVNSLDRSMVGLGGSSDGVTKSMLSLSKVALAVSSAISASVVTRYADAFKSLQNQLRQTTSTYKELNVLTKDILDISNRSRAEIGATSDLYTQLALSTESLNLSTAEQLRLTETITKSFAVSGKTAAESAGAIRQLGQALGSGALRGDEFNSIAEGAPEILRALQRELGLTSGELRAFAATGGITAEVLVGALGNAAEVIDDKMSRSVQTFAQATTEADNNFTIFIGKVDEATGISSAFGSSMVETSRTVLGLTDDAIALIDSVRAVGAVWLASAEQVRSGASGIGDAYTSEMGALVATTDATVDFLIDAFKNIAPNIKASVQIAVVELTSFIDEIRLKIAEFNADTAFISEAVGGLSQENADIFLENLKTEIEARRSVKAEVINGFLEEREAATRNYDERIAQIESERAARAAASDVSSAPKTSGSESVIADSEFQSKLEEETQQLRLNLQLRQAIRDEFITYDQARAIEVATNKLANQQATFDAEILKLGENEAAKAELLATFREAQKLAVAEFELSLTDIVSEESERRNQIKQREATQAIGTYSNYANAAISLESAFGSKSEKAQKRRRKAAVIIDTAAGIGRAFAENNFYVALGMSAAIAANGIAQIAAINSASSAPQSNVSAGGIPSDSAAAPSAPTSSTVIDFRARPGQSFTADDVRDILGSVEGVTLINNGLENARRLGEI